MARTTAALVSGATARVPFTTCETVVIDTPARSAMSRWVGRAGRCCRIPLLPSWQTPQTPAQTLARSSIEVTTGPDHSRRSGRARQLRIGVLGDVGVHRAAHLLPVAHHPEGRAT